MRDNVRHARLPLTSSSVVELFPQRSTVQHIPEKAYCSTIQFSLNCCAKRSAEPICTLAGDLNGCQMQQRIVFPFDCCGAGRNQ